MCVFIENDAWNDEHKIHRIPVAPSRDLNPDPSANNS
jgi:hypothetical protein